MDIKNYTRKQITDSILKLLDQYSKNGVVITGNPEYCADIENRIPLIFNAALKKAYSDLPLKNSAKLCFPKNEIEYCLKERELPKGQALLIQIKRSENTHFFVADFVGAFTLKVTANGKTSTIVEEKSDDGVMKTVRGKIPPSYSSADIIVSSQNTGSYIDSLIIYTPEKGLMLYDENFAPLPGKCCCAVPSDFGSLLSVTNRANGRNVNPDCFILDGVALYADEDYMGIYDISYYVKPPQIADKAKSASESVKSDLSESYAISEIRFELAARRTAAELCPPGDTETYSMLLHSYNELFEAFCKKRIPTARDRNTFFRTRTSGKFKAGGDY